MVVTIGNRETGNFWTEGSQGVHLRLSSPLRYQLGSVKLFLSRYTFNSLYFYSLIPDSRENIAVDLENDCFLNETQFLHSGVLMETLTQMIIRPNHGSLHLEKSIWNIWKNSQRMSY